MVNEYIEEKRIDKAQRTMEALKEIWEFPVDSLHVCKKDGNLRLEADFISEKGILKERKVLEQIDTLHKAQEQLVYMFGIEAGDKLNQFIREKFEELNRLRGSSKRKKITASKVET